jgi:tripartite-type tricarboxylate transporter receptor subunit TctC
MRVVSRLVFILACSMMPTLARAEFPTHTVTIVVGYAAGGSNDRAGRLIADGLRKLWGKPAIVENRPGAGGVVAANYVSHAKPDGHTLMVGPVSLTMLQASQKTARFDLTKEFVPVAMLASVPMAVFVSPKSPIKSIKDLVTTGSQREINFGTSGVAAIDTFAIELLKKSTGIKALNVQYTGGTEIVRDVIAGHIDASISSVAQVAEQVRGGSVRGVGIAGNERSFALPDIPTLAESGIKGVDVTQWWGIFAPAGTPADVVNQLNSDINTVLKSDETKAQFRMDGSEVKPMTTAEFDAMVKSEIQKWTEIANASGISVD